MHRFQRIFFEQSLIFQRPKTKAEKAPHLPIICFGKIFNQRQIPRHRITFLPLFQLKQALAKTLFRRHHVIAEIKRRPHGHQAAFLRCLPIDKRHFHQFAQLVDFRNIRRNNRIFGKIMLKSSIFRQKQSIFTRIKPQIFNHFFYVGGLNHIHRQILIVRHKHPIAVSVGAKQKINIVEVFKFRL